MRPRPDTPVGHGHGRRRSRGVTLIELMVGVVVLLLLLMMAAPSIGSWMDNARLRTTAEALSASLQFARAEAVSRNARVRLQLTSTLDNSCALSDTGPHWVVNLDPSAEEDAVAGACGAALSDTAAPRILQTHNAREGGANTRLQGSASTLVFNGLGRLNPVPAGDISFDVQPADERLCAANGGTLGCLRVLVSPMGQVLMCSPAVSAPDPRACP